MKGFLFLALLSIFAHSAAGSVTWSRSILIYHNAARTSIQWQRHLLRIDGATGALNPTTSHWLFDSAILTTEAINGKDIYSGGSLTGTDCLDLIQALKSDVQALNTAIGAAKQVVPRPGGSSAPPFAVYIAVPYFNVYNSQFTIPNGPIVHLWYSDQRSTAMHWYLDQIHQQFANAATDYPNLQITGVYYHHEDVGDQDVSFVQDFNVYAHSIGLGTVFVPYYDSPNVWYNKGLGFDAVVVQPRYSYLSSIDGSVLRGDRLYSTGKKALAHGVGLEYELRNSGSGYVEYWIAHQYLAISQWTGVNANPQVFFVGPYSEIFDSTTSQAQASAGGSYTWATYTDLCDYLKGNSIGNYEVGIQPPTTEVQPNVREMVWTSAYPGLASIRLDFNDPDPANIWRGRVAVLVNGDPMHSSYAARAGVEQPGVEPSYQSVFVPLASENIAFGTPLTIQIIKEPTSPWPNVLLLVGAPYEPKYITSPIVGQPSTSSHSQAAGSYTDSAATHLGYATGGKLNNGRTSSVGTWDDAVAFPWIERRFTVTIDLGAQQPVSRVVVQASRDQGVGVNWPNSTVAFVSGACEPAERGTLAPGAGSCPPQYASGAPVVSVTYWDGGGRFDGTVTLSMAPGAAGRFVAVSGVCYGLCMIHEISVYGGTSGNTLLSAGKAYRVNPKPGDYTSVPGGEWSDDSRLLTDGAVFGDWIAGDHNTVGIKSTNGGSVESTFLQPRTGFTWAVVWVTRRNDGAGITQPASVTMSWRDASSTWATGVSVPVVECSGGLAPCAKLQLPAGAQVTGIRGIFGSTDSWYMVSEISLMN